MQKTDKFSVKISESVKDISPHEWDSIFPKTPEGYSFFKTIEETLSEQFKLYYISIYSENTIICLAPCFIANYPLDTTLEGPVKNAVLMIRKIFPKFFIIRAAICGSPLFQGRLGIKDSSDSHRLIRLIAENLGTLAKKEHAAFVAFRDFSEEYTKLLDPLTDMDFYKIDSFPTAELELKHTSFEEYFESLSKATRIDLRRKFKKTDNENIEIEIRTDIDDILDEAYKMYLDNTGHSDVLFERITKDFFYRIPKNAPEKTRFLIMKMNGKLAGFHLLLFKDSVMTGQYMGLDYTIAYKYNLYFVLMRETIRWCIQNKIHIYDAGALSYDPKKRLDFRFIPQYIYARHRNSFANFLFRFVIALVKPEKFDPVLKTMNNRSSE